jgi:hypothetical protein
MYSQDNIMIDRFKKLYQKAIKLTITFLPILSLSACGAKTMTEFDWLASEGAPENFPMEILNGTFHFKSGGGVYVPSGALLYKMWGKYRSTHVSGPALKPAPSKLSITFFSYTENKFYQGEFDLPYDKILALFQQAYYSTKQRGETRYDTITAGVSPGGGVAVWLNGLNRNTQVFYGKAQEVDLDWSVKTKNKMPRDTYIKEVIEESIPAQDYKKLVTEGVPLDRWDNYQQRHHWQLNLLTENRAPKLVEEISYVNGEVDYFFYPLAEDIAKQTRAVPKSLYYSWKSPEGKPLDLHYEFDVDELSAVFKEFEARKPATADEPILLSLYLWEHKDGRRWGVAVQRGDEETILKNVKLEVRRSNSELDDADAFYQDDE